MRDELYRATTQIKIYARQVMRASKIGDSEGMLNNMERLEKAFDEYDSLVEKYDRAKNV